MSRAQPPTLHDFIDEELLRVPLTLNTVIDAVLERWCLRPPGWGQADSQAHRVLQSHREDVIARTLRALRQSATADLRRIGERKASAPLSPLPARRELSLIGEDDVAADIEVARCIEAVKLEADTELRELLTYTSALVKDLNVSRDTNPFRPDLYVRAVWDGVMALPLTRLAQAAFLREAAQPLAKSLRKAYAASATRLEEEGVTPAVYRTIVHPAGTGWGGQLRYQPPERLSDLRSAMPAARESARTATDWLGSHTTAAAPGQTPHGDRGRAPMGAASAAHGSEAARADPQLRELLRQLFDTIESDNGLSPDVVVLLHKLQAVIVGAALADDSLLHDYAHPAWRFMDHLAYHMALCAAAERMRLLSLCRHLVDHLASADPHDRSRFVWAIERLVAAQRSALQQAVAAAAPVIARMQSKARGGAMTSTPMPLDFQSMDTVPADLDTLEESPLFDPTGESPGAPGDHWRVYLQGDWRWVQLLWRDDSDEIWLMREPAADRHWAMRAQGLDRLRQEGLAHPLRMRSLIRRAAAKLRHLHGAAAAAAGAAPPSTSPGAAPTPKPVAASGAGQPASRTASA